MNRRGFTAPELAIVVLIIMAASLAVMRGNAVAQHRARDTTCMTNLKQLATALHMYATDNDYRLPPQPKAWEPVYAYVKNEDILRCPQTRHAEKSDEAELGDSDYLLNPTVQTDDLPSVIIAGDDAPDRHSGRRWIGVRLDGAAALWPAEQWAAKLGKVSKHAKDNR